MNTKRIISAAFAGLAVICWFFVRQVVDTLWGVAKLQVPQDWPFSPADLVGAIAAVAVFVILQRHKKINQFSSEVLTELSKVTWPPKKETLLSTVVIAVMVAICSVILFSFDTLWGTLVKVLYQ